MHERSSAIELVRVAAVSDQIRHLAHQGFLMQLHAMNAMVMTRSHSVRVPGFEVVSEQMRQLSGELGACLGALRAATVRWLRIVSHEVAAARQIAILRSAAAASPPAARLVDPVLSSLVAATEATGTAATEATGTAAARRAFVELLDNARQLAATGCVLARTAKFEATYGGGLASKLGVVATSFTELADVMDEAVRTIARRLGDGHRSSP